MGFNSGFKELKTMRFDETDSYICRYHTARKADCESPMRQQKNQIVLQDGEIDRRQHAAIHSDSLHINVKDSTTGEKG
jgi:hypothetical protein